MLLVQGTEWSAKSEVFGIWRMIVGTFVLTAYAVLLGGTMDMDKLKVVISNLRKNM